MKGLRSDPLLCAMIAIAGVVLFVITLPLIVVAATSFNPTEESAFPPNGWSLRWFFNIAQQPQLVHAFKISLALAFLSSIASTAIGTAAALTLHRNSFRGRGAIDAWLMSPLIVPQVIVGLAYLVFFIQIGSRMTFLNLAILHATLTLPYSIRLVRSALLQLNARTEEAAVGLGASQWQALWLVVLPQIRTSLLISFLFSFVLSFDNFTATAFLTSDVETLPVAIFTYLDATQDPTISAISTLLTIATSLFVIVADRLVGMRRLVR